LPEVVASLGLLEKAVRARLKALGQSGIVSRIWARDPTVWKPLGTPEIENRLGWLTVADWMLERLAELSEFALEARSAASRFVLCGMGGSSLAPQVAREIFGGGEKELLVLDTIHPAAIAAVDRSSGSSTLYLISSKSGTTQETASLLQHYWQATGGAAQRFVAITDPATPLAQCARERGFRRAFLNPQDIGGRYSALSYFGTVPASLTGANLEALLASGQRMANSCRDTTDWESNPGAWLGAVLGEAAAVGRDKLTLVLSPPLERFGLWLEQLVAESLGKEGRGIVPVVGEPLGPVGVYGSDRLFVAIALAGRESAEQRQLVQALGEAGHPWVRFSWSDPSDLGAEFFRWEFATAVAGAILGVNPFDQPDVQESKDNTRALLAGRGGGRPAVSDRSAVERLLEGARPGDYIALLAFLAPSPETDARLARLQRSLRDRTGAAVTVGYGPRFLHSTGQLHKGGPPRGWFIQIIDQPQPDLPIPGEGITFGQLLAAEADGDFRALQGRGRPVVRVMGLEALEEAVFG
jgi:glucose-6-phosphate isomerase